MIAQEQLEAAASAEAPDLKPPVVEEEPLKKDGLYLDLACGQRKKEGHHGVDIAENVGADTIWDLRQTPWPFDDESVDGAYCAHYLEHIPGYLDGPRRLGPEFVKFKAPFDRMDFFSELWRILKPGAKATIICPYGWSDRAMQDPTHMWPPVVSSSFLYANEAWRRNNLLTHGPYERLRCHFDPIELMFPPLENGWNDRADTAKQVAIMHYVNVIPDIIAKMTKAERLPEVE